MAVYKIDFFLRTPIEVFLFFERKAAAIAVVFFYFGKGDMIMRIKTRETVTGTEYWDNVEKRTVFVPHGEAPGFEFKERREVDSMLDKAQAVDDDAAEAIDFEAMTIKQLKKYAADNEIEIPEDATKKADIITALTDA